MFICGIFWNANFLQELCKYYVWILCLLVIFCINSQLNVIFYFFTHFLFALLWRIAKFTKQFAKFIEVLLDGILLILAVIAFLIAAIVLEHGQPFDDGAGTTIYYDLGTFYNTFTRTVGDSMYWTPVFCSNLYLFFFITMWSSLVSLCSISCFYKECNVYWNVVFNSFVLLIVDVKYQPLCCMYPPWIFLFYLFYICYHGRCIQCMSS